MKKNSQRQYERVLELLQAGVKLSPINAIPMVGTISLQYHVFKLRKQGYKIKTNVVRNGSLKYAEYELMRG